MSTTARPAGWKNGRRLGAPPKAYTPPATPQGKVNLTDPDSRLVHGMRGWVQGYNAQAVCNEQHLIVAADAMTASPDFGHLGPMVAAARGELAAAGVSASPKAVLADAGYWHLEQMNEITADARPGWRGGAHAFMRWPRHHQGAYKRRAQLIEPIFANAKHNRGFTRFPTPRKSSSTDRMAPDGHHPQPSETAPPLQRPG